ncbi:catalytic, putative [Ricinus communis]|uniref:Catalytic, putative n=1 Tax=Ricinus communis TaxID=3988 RepID=B9SJR1_RICCO|nr:catalytic, putative [Ricinus communis]|eukprot:XP_002526230.1 probable carboxylesterase 2 [Ricinus communis]
MESKAEVSRFIYPYVRIYKDGSIERLAGTEAAPAGLDPKSGVLSKDILIIPETGVSARLYLPNSTKPHQKLPLVIYYHGGGFYLSSTADPCYHNSLNKIVAEANIILVSVNYRLAPETPLPGAYEDSWTALERVASHAKDGGSNNEVWLQEYADFGLVFLAGDSCGANMAHHFGLKLKDSELGRQLKIRGIAAINPYFWGKDPIGVEITDHLRKTMVDNWWMLVCPSDKGCDDPLINPFVDGSLNLEGLACERVLVVVAEKDILKDRGRAYYENLVKSKWQGNAEIVEIEGEDHVFHIFYPHCEKAKTLFKRLASFFNQS